MKRKNALMRNFLLRIVPLDKKKKKTKKKKKKKKKHIDFNSTVRYTLSIILHEQKYSFFKVQDMTFFSLF